MCGVVMFGSMTLRYISQFLHFGLLFPVFSIAAFFRSVSQYVQVLQSSVHFCMFSKKFSLSRTLLFMNVK